MVNDPDVPPNLCFPGKEEVASMVAKITGKQLASVENVVAYARCSRIEGKVKKGSQYYGFSTCTAAKLAYGGPWECKYACIGLGECAEACPFDAISMEDNFPRVDQELCVGCGTCVRTCPNNVMELIPVKARVWVPCNSRDKAKQVKEVCESGCISCKICIRSCPAKAVSMENDIIKIDHKICMGYGPDCAEICVEKCPRDIFRMYTPDDFKQGFYHEIENLPMDCGCCEDKCTT